MPKTCSFCLGNDHYLRNQIAVTCPKLLDTQCNNCYKFGHTTNFCKENPDKLEKVRIFNSIHSSKPQSLIVKPKKNNFLAVASRFAALEVKECNFDNSSDYDSDSESEIDINTQKNDYSEDDELPPVSAIIWGKGFASNYQKKKWSD
jgi:hypothetical protein